jgi:hypothetical protein
MSAHELAQAFAIPQACTTCRVCGEVKPRSEYYHHQVRKCGTVGECKECTKTRVRRRAMTDPKVQEYERARSKTPARRAHIASVAKRWTEKNPEAHRAHYAVTNAVRDGRLKRAPCLFCGADQVHGHHRDYSRPLDVIWLCPKCHHRLHANFPETAAHERKD